MIRDIIALLVIVSAIIAAYSNLENSANAVHTQQNKFYNGEILLPDYVHLDTLVVVAADSLNRMMPQTDGSDFEINQLLGAFCVPVGSKITPCE